MILYQILLVQKFDGCVPGSRSASTDEMLETENNRMVDELAVKVSRLKGVIVYFFSHSQCSLSVSLLSFASKKEKGPCIE